MAEMAASCVSAWGARRRARRARGAGRMRGRMQDSFVDHQPVAAAPDGNTEDDLIETLGEAEAVVEADLPQPGEPVYAPDITALADTAPATADDFAAQEDEAEED
jgi:hypothetical protein